MSGPVSTPPISALVIDFKFRYIIEQRLKNIQFQFTDAIYVAVIQGNYTDIQSYLFSTMSAIYQVYLSICMSSCRTSTLPLVDTYFSAASNALFVPTKNGSTVIGIADAPLQYLFISAVSVHILASLLALLAISSLSVAYQLHYKNNRDGFAQKLAAITGSPFTLAGAVYMSAGQLWANELIAAPNGETLGLLSDTQTRHFDQEKETLSTVTSRRETMERLAQYTYELDWSGKIVRNS